MHVPFKDTTLNLGSGPPVNGAGITTGEGDIFTYAQGATNVESVGPIWIQSNGTAGIVADGGVTIGTDDGFRGTAAKDVQLWAGAGTSANLGSPNGPKGPPTEPTAPCSATADSVNRKNGLNGMIKGAADVATGLADGDRWTAAKGGWDAVKGANDMSGGTLMDENTVKAIDTVAKVGDVLNSGNAVDAIASASALGGGHLMNAMFGSGGADAGGGEAGHRDEGVGGGGKIIAKAPGNIEKTTDSNMTAIVAQKIEYKAGTDIAMQAANKVETQSLFFEAHANVQAAMKGLARAKVESVGYAVMEGRAKFEVKTNAVGKIESGGTLDILSTGLMTIKGAAGMKINGGPKINVHTSDFKMNATSSAEIAGPKTKICGEFEVTKDAFLKAEAKAKTLKVLKGSEMDGTLLVKKKVTCKSMCQFG